MELDGVDRKSGPSLDTVRALHQTVVALRAALEQSRSEILELKSKAWPIDEVQDTLKSLSIENHILRRAVIEKGAVTSEKTDDQGTDRPKAIEGRIEDDRVVLEEEIEKDPNKDTLNDTDQTIFSNIQNNIPSKEIAISESEIEDGIDNPKELQTEEGTDYPKELQIEDSTDSLKTAEILEVLADTDKDTGEVAHNHLSSKNISELEVAKDKSTEELKDKPYKIKKDDLVKKQVKIVSPRSVKKDTSGPCFEAKISIKTETFSARKISKSLESLTIINTPISPRGGRKLTISKTVSFSHIDSQEDLEGDTSPTMDKDKECEEVAEACGTSNEYADDLHSPQDELDQDQDEVDDIELIFTTDEMRETDLKEHLVSIDAGDSAAETSHLLRCPVSDLEQLDVSDRELDDDVFNEGDLEGDRRDNLNDELKPSGCRKSLSQMYNSKSDNSINNEEKSLKSCCSYQDSSFENKSLEKDESFDRFEERVRIIETDISKCGIQDVEYNTIRRNTCPNPLQYRPLLHREALSKGHNSKKSRPILAHSNAVRRESGAQTDISAIPGSTWRSESSLANKAKMSDNFTTLPSKFPLPGSRLRLSEKTVEARRVLLSDIGFTSMVPELSRSADHLCPGALKPPMVTPYGQFLRTPDLYSPGYALNSSQRFTWTATTATPSEGSHSRYSSLYPLSPPATSRRCSAPVSPSRRALLAGRGAGGSVGAVGPGRVRFANGSLPELRGDWGLGADSGDSTDSLVEEAENYLRRSIDCIVGGRDVLAYSEMKRTVPRRASAPEPAADNVPPQGWQPFLPRVPRDLKLDHWVKVITAEGRVRGGRVRYIGPLATQPDQHVGVQLSTPDGTTDGTFSTRRYFQCEPYHGIFVPFKKVIMGWRP